MSITSQETTLFDLPHPANPMEIHEDLIIVNQGQTVLNQSYDTALARLYALMSYMRTNHAGDATMDDLLKDLRHQVDSLPEVDPNLILRSLMTMSKDLDINIIIDTRLTPAMLPQKIYSIITRSDNPAIALNLQHFTSREQRTASLRTQAETLGVLVRLSASDSTIIASLAGALTALNDSPTHLTLVATDRLDDGSACNDGSLRYDPAVSVTTTTISSH